MRSISILLVFLFVYNIKYAQKEDSHWLTGRHTKVVDNNYKNGINVFDFSADPVNIIRSNDIVSAFQLTCSTISDKSTGSLLTYSNGMHLLGNEYKTITGGERINFNNYTSTEYADLLSLTSEYKDKIEQIESIGESELDSELLLSKMDTLIVIDSLLQNIIDNAKNRWMNSLSNIKNEIDNLTEYYYFNNDWKEMKKALIDYHLYGINYIKDNHSELINEVSLKCSHEYGEAVLMAKSLQHILNDKNQFIHYDCYNESEQRNRKSGSENDVTILPNPTSNSILIELNNFKISTIKVYNNQGKMVINNELLFAQNSVKLNVQSLVSGIYTIQLIKDDGEIVTKKFIKVN